MSSQYQQQQPPHRSTPLRRRRLTSPHVHPQRLYQQHQQERRTSTKMMEDVQDQQQQQQQDYYYDEKDVGSVEMMGHEVRFEESLPLFFHHGGDQASIFKVEEEDDDDGHHQKLQYPHGGEHSVGEFREDPEYNDDDHDHVGVEDQHTIPSTIETTPSASLSLTGGGGGGGEIVLTHPPLPLPGTSPSSGFSSSSPVVLLRLIAQRQFEKALQRVQQYPQEANISWYQGRQQQQQQQQQQEQSRNGTVPSTAIPASTGPNIHLSDPNMALHEACKHQAPPALIQALLRANEAACSVAGQWGYLPLHFACCSRADPAIVSLLITRYPSATRSKSNPEGRLPLHCAAKWGAESTTLLALLTVHPKGYLTKDASGKTPLDLATKSGGVGSGGSASMMLAPLSPTRTNSTVDILTHCAPMLLQVSKAAMNKLSWDSENKVRLAVAQFDEECQRMQLLFEQEKARIQASEQDSQQDLCQAKEAYERVSNQLQGLQKTKGQLSMQLQEQRIENGRLLKQVKELQDELRVRVSNEQQQTQEFQSVLRAKEIELDETKRLLQQIQGLSTAGSESYGRDRLAGNNDPSLIMQQQQQHQPPHDGPRQDNHHHFFKERTSDDHRTHYSDGAWSPRRNATSPRRQNQHTSRDQDARNSNQFVDYPASSTSFSSSKKTHQSDSVIYHRVNERHKTKASSSPRISSPTRRMKNGHRQDIGSSNVKFSPRQTAVTSTTASNRNTNVQVGHKSEKVARLSPRRDAVASVKGWFSSQEGPPRTANSKDDDLLNELLAPEKGVDRQAYNVESRDDQMEAARNSYQRDQSGFQREELQFGERKRDSRYYSDPTGQSKWSHQPSSPSKQTLLSRSKSAPRQRIAPAYGTHNNSAPTEYLDTEKNLPRSYNQYERHQDFDPAVGQRRQNRTTNPQSYASSVPSTQQRKVLLTSALGGRRDMVGSRTDNNKSHKNNNFSLKHGQHGRVPSSSYREGRPHADSYDSSIMSDVSNNVLAYD